jgi:hypothetical protein
MQLIHGTDVYEGLNSTPMMHTWGQVNHHIFEAIISKVKPKLIIEIGTWLGGSAIRMADICKELKLDCTIICVDTWLGGYGELKSKDANQLRKVNGWPHMYYTFLANVVEAGHQDMIVPFPNTSTIACKFIEDYGLKADVIYVDGSHLEEDVYRDLVQYTPLLRNKNSQMFGDDLHSPPIERAVSGFCEGSEYQYCNIDNHFWTLELADDADSDTD